MSNFYRDTLLIVSSFVLGVLALFDTCVFVIGLFTYIDGPSSVTVVILNFVAIIFSSIGFHLAYKNDNKK